MFWKPSTLFKAESSEMGVEHISAGMGLKLEAKYCYKVGGNVPTLGKSLGNSGRQTPRKMLQSHQCG